MKSKPRLEPGVGRNRDLWVYFDAFTELIYCYPQMGKSEEETQLSMQDFMGRDYQIALLYSDNYASIISSCKKLTITHERSTPYDSANNSWAENTVQVVEGGVGFASCSWNAGMHVANGCSLLLHGN